MKHLLTNTYMYGELKATWTMYQVVTMTEN